MYEPTEIEKQAIQLLRDEKAAWQSASVWVSSSTFFGMKQEIDDARKNYYGQFVEPTDPDTHLEKLFIPLTEWTVERMVTNIDLDTKDIHLRSPQGKNSRVALTMKLVLANFLKKMNFGETLNDLLRRLAIDGTGIIKYYNQYSLEYKRNLPTLRIVDPLNFIIDPTVHSIQEATSVMERAELTKTNIERYGWKNTEHIDYSPNVPTAIMYERWGEVPLDWITGSTSDVNKWVEGIIVASAIRDERGDGPIAVIHKIARNPSGVRPYEDAWLRRVPNRWHGRGVPEQLRHLQEWLNTVVNIRRDEMLNKLTGKYKFRKGSGITKQMLQSLRAGGAIPVDEMDDIQEMAEKDVQASAYKEPAEVLEMAERVTGARETPTAPGMQPTTAVIQERSVRSVTNLIQENVGLCLERLFKRGIVPLMAKDLKDGEVLRITGEPQDLEIIDESYMNYKFQEAMAKAKRRLTIFEQARLRQRIEKALKAQGTDRSLAVRKHILDTDYEVDVSVTAERFDPSIVLKQLNDFLFAYARLPQADLGVINSVVQEYLNTLNVPIARLQPKTAPPAPQPAEQPQRPTGETPTPRTEFNRAAMEGTISPAPRPA